MPAHGSGDVGWVGRQGAIRTAGRHVWIEVVILTARILLEVVIVGGVVGVDAFE